MTTGRLNEGDIEKLFSGAPQFFARSEGHFAGAPHPSVAFPFDEELEIRDLTDHVQIEDRAWSGVTAWPHLTRDLNHDAAAKRQARERHRAHFHIRARERPNMLSMQGLEKGTMGYQAALELPVGDSLEEEQFGFQSVGTKARAVVEARERMLSDSGWLRRLPELEIVDRLKRNGEIYRDNDLRKRKSVDTYKDLFHTFMRPGNFVIDKSDHYSLTNQINALVKCLASSNVWIDFSRVEWRIRLGQILWGREEGDELGDSTTLHDATSSRERDEEKYWLLMQILLATELLVRLDAITEGQEYGGESFRQTDVSYFERNANHMVKWSLLLARSWLENIEVVKLDGTSATQSHYRTGWLASLASKISLHSSQHESRTPRPLHAYTIQGRHGQRQVDGLTHFARKLRWPGVDTYETRLTEAVQNNIARVMPTPAPASVSTESKESSYFGAWDVSVHRRKPHEVVQTQRRRLAAALHASGWLSKSYVFGLMLPGEVTSHYLMATLLENDEDALSRLGSFANLCGGFVYANKSFWSTSCIVGRVLAAGKGSAECMGWVSTDVVPRGFGDGWISIEVEDVPGDMSQLGKKARLWGKKRVERDASILGDGDERSVLPGDFIIPYENGYSTPPPIVFVELQSLQLAAATASVQPTPLTELTPTVSVDTSKAPELPSYPANVRFKVSTSEDAEETLIFLLSHDVNFVTAHPCSPSQRVKFLKSPTSPTIQKIDVSGLDMLGNNSRPAHRMGHPLHKFFSYTVIHISELIQKRGAALSELIQSQGPIKQAQSAAKLSNNGVLVVDCITNFAEPPQSPTLERVDTGSSSLLAERRDSFPAAAQMHLESHRRQFGSDMEILVRALCAEKGWNAVISRRKRGCLACAVREAAALGWKVIVRVE